MSLQNKKKILFFSSVFFIILFINIISSLQVITPNNNVTITKDSIYTFNINIKNDKNYDVYNITLESNYLKMNNINKLSVNESINISVVININAVGSYNENVKLLSFTKINCSELGVKTHDITLQNINYNPLMLCRGDNIRFTNNFTYPITLKIYRSSGAEYISNDININQSYITQNFDESGNFHFTDRFSALFFGDIKVNEEESLLHSIDDDFNFNFKIIALNTSITVDAITLNYSVEYNSEKTTFFVINNIGNEIAYNINLAGEWFFFDENNFNLGISNSRAINFRIQPFIDDTSKTNKTYVKNITIKTDNGNVIIKEYFIYIPYSLITAANDSLPAFWMEKKRFCDAFPTSQLCITEPIVIYRNITIYEGPPVNANLSAKKFQELVDEFLSEKAERDTQNNFLKSALDTFQSTSASADSKLNEVVSDILNMKIDMKNLKSSVIVFLSLIFFIAAFIFGSFFIFRLYINKTKGKLPTYK